MTDFLRCNGIPIPVLDESATDSPEEIGDRRRAIDGSMLLERRAVKSAWEFETALQDPATALAMRDLLLGRGHVWTFESSLYGSRGVPIASGGSAVATYAKFGTKSLEVAPSTNAVISGLDWNPATAPWSAAFWITTGSGWYHIVESSAGRRYQNGVDVGTNLYVTTGTNTINLRNVSGVLGLWFDDVWLAPYLFPTTWPAALYAYGSAVGLAPRLNVDGLMIDHNRAGGSVCVAEVASVRPRQGYSGGSFSADLRSIRATLHEV